MPTANLNLEYLAQNQNSPEVTINEGFDRLDAAISGLLTHEMTADADYTLDTVPEPPEWMNFTIQITDSPATLTAARNIIVPNEVKFYLFQNDTAQTLTIKTSAGTGVAVIAGERALVRCDGTNVVLVLTSERAVTASGSPTNGQVATFTAGGDEIEGQALADVTDSVTSDGTTGGTGSAGAGNQHVEVTIGGTTYKFLHDGTV